MTVRESMSLVAKMLRLDKDQLMKEIGGVAPFLVPFLKMACVYFLLDLPNQPLVTKAFVKALPILSLVWLVCLQGVGLGRPSSDFITYNRRILCGLLFCCLGDVALVWQEKELYFVLGMLAFACAHVCYIVAFGIHPFGLKELVPCLLCCVLVLGAVVPCIAPGVLAWAVPLYVVLVACMAWRSLARFTLRGDIPWRKIFSAIGAFLFATSDVVLALNKFCFAIPFEHELVMVTYYSGQLCIALSVINSHLHESHNGTVATPTNGIVATPTNGIVATPTNSIVATPTNGIVASPINGTVATPTNGTLPGSPDSMATPPSQNHCSNGASLRWRGDKQILEQ